jgi:hypothetical protein
MFKIDIENFEPYAFSNCKKLFALYNIQRIFMEWGNLIKHAELGLLINNMLDFFYSYNLEPYSISHRKLAKKMRYDDNITWHFDIIWKRTI